MKMEMSVYNGLNLAFLAFFVVVISADDSNAIGFTVSCIPGHLYCGNQISHFVVRRELARNKTLYECGSDGKFILLAICDAGCTAVENGNSSCLCFPGQLYCGWDLFGVGPSNFMDNALYLCDETTLNVNVVQTCDSGCVAGVTAHRPPQCFGYCRANKTYCGDELQALGLEGYYDKNVVYQCNSEGTDASMYHKCVLGTCASGNCTCEPGRFYCAYEFHKTLGLKNANMHSQLAQCGKTRFAVQISDMYCPTCFSNDDNSTCVCDPDSHCEPECRPRTNSAWCPCSYGSHYCGLELWKLGWQGHRNNTLYVCEKGGNNVNSFQVCESDCVSFDGHKGCAGKCTPGVKYCGSYLQNFGFPVDSNDTVYKCSLDGLRVSEWKSCTKGTCSLGRCDCEVGRNYCPTELDEQLGWEGQETAPSGLRQCHELVLFGKRIQFASTIQCPDCTAWNAPSACQCEPDVKCDSECWPKTNASWCKCTVEFSYCGHELSRIGWQDYDANTIYKCDGGNNVKTMQMCDDGCHREIFMVKCLRQCVQEELYCGYELLELGLDGYENKTLFKCNSGGKNASSWRNCTNGCIQKACKCDPGRSYCAHELRALGWSYIQASASTLFECLPGGTAVGQSRATFMCPKCIGANERSACMCEPNSTDCSRECRPRTNTSWCECMNFGVYCGHELNELGWQDYDNSTIYHCALGNNVQIMGKCAETCIRLVDATITCSGYCIKGSKYCAYQLSELGYIANFNYSTLYVCKDSHSLPINTGETSDQCRQRCVAGQSYCGYSLHYRYSIPNENLHYLYKCTCRGIAEVVAACSVCVENNGNAYCATSWYWYFLGTALFLIFSMLTFVLVRTALKHRLLQKLIDAQRIDADQLATTSPLGKGEFGEVRKATYKPQTGDTVEAALKISNVFTDPARKLECANSFFHEVIALNVLTHENIIKAFGVCTNYKDAFGNTVPALVLEYMNGGSATSYMRSARQDLTGRELIQIFLDISLAGDHLSKMGIIHRDIAARNVLIQTDVNNGHMKVAKLTDFGLAKDIGKKVSIYKSTHPERSTIPFRYTAPEAFAGSFSSKSDVWAFGVLIWEMYSILDEGNDTALKPEDPAPMPYPNIDLPKELFEELCVGLRLKQPRSAPDGTYRKMLECWNMKPESWPSFEDLNRFFNSKRGAADSQIIAQQAQRVLAAPPVRIAKGEEIEMRSYEEGGYVSPDTIH